jgi:hypothetical protein
LAEETDYYVFDEQLELAGENKATRDLLLLESQTFGFSDKPVALNAAGLPELEIVRVANHTGSRAVAAEQAESNSEPGGDNKAGDGKTKPGDSPGEKEYAEVKAGLPKDLKPMEFPGGRTYYFDAEGIPRMVINNGKEFVFNWRGDYLQSINGPDGWSTRFTADGWQRTDNNGGAYGAPRESIALAASDGSPTEHFGALHKDFYRAGSLADIPAIAADFATTVSELMESDSPEKAKYLARMLAGMDSAQINKLQEEYGNQTGGRKFLEDLKQVQANGNLSQETFNFISSSINMPNDSRTADQTVQLARVALLNPDPEMRLSLLHLAMAGDSPRSIEARQKFMAANGELAINEFLRDDTAANKEKAMQILRDGRIDINTLVREQDGYVFAGEKTVDNLIADFMTDQDRKNYQRGKELSRGDTSSLNEEDRKALDYYNKLHQTLAYMAPRTEGILDRNVQDTAVMNRSLVKWEDLIANGGKPSLIGKIVANRDDTNGVVAAINSMDNATYQRLKSDPKFRKEVENAIHVAFTEPYAPSRGRAFNFLNEALAKRTFDDVGKMDPERLVTQFMEWRNYPERIPAILARADSQTQWKIQNDRQYATQIERMINQQLPAGSPEQALARVQYDEIKTGRNDVRGLTKQVLSDMVNQSGKDTVLSHLVTSLHSNRDLANKVSEGLRNGDPEVARLKSWLDKAVGNPQAASDILNGGGYSLDALKRANTKQEMGYNPQNPRAPRQVDVLDGNAFVASLPALSKSDAEAILANRGNQAAMDQTFAGVNPKMREVALNILSQDRTAQPEDNLRMFVLNRGGNTSKFFETMRGKSEIDKAEIYDAYRKKYGSDAVQDLSKLNLSTDQQRAVMESARLGSRTALGDVNRALNENAKESDVGSFGRSLTRILSEDKYSVSEESARKAASIYQEAQIDRKLTADESQRLQTAMGELRQAVEDVRAGKAEAKEKVTKAAITAGVILSIPLGGQGLAAAALSAALPLAVTEVALKKAIDGSAYSKDQLAKDAYEVAIALAMDSAIIVAPHVARFLSVRSAGLLREGVQETALANDLTRVGNKAMHNPALAEKELDRVVGKYAVPGREPELRAAIQREWKQEAERVVQQRVTQKELVTERLKANNPDRVQRASSEVPNVPRDRGQPLNYVEYQEFLKLGKKIAKEGPSSLDVAEASRFQSLSTRVRPYDEIDLAKMETMPYSAEDYKRWVDQMYIPTNQIKSDPTRIASVSKTTDAIEHVKPDAATRAHKDWQEFSQELSYSNDPVREYRIKGHENVPIIVPEEYAAKLDKIREWRTQAAKDIAANPTEAPKILYARTRLALTENKRALLPEDMAALLDEVPNPERITKIQMIEGNSPQQAFFAEQAKAAGKNYGPVEADANISAGYVRFFRNTEKQNLMLNGKHEWSHLAEKNKAFDSFMEAEKIERTDKWNRRGYAAENEHENWAVHFGEVLLDPNQNLVPELVNNAPLRSLSLAEGLKGELALGPKNPAAKQMAERIAYIEDQAIPKAQERLKELLLSGNPADEKAALSYLEELRKINPELPAKLSDARLTTALAKKTMDWDTADGLVQLTREGLAKHPNELIDALVDISANEAAKRPVARALQEYKTVDARLALIDVEYNLFPSVKGLSDMQLLNAMRDLGQRDALLVLDKGYPMMSDYAKKMFAEEMERRYKNDARMQEAIRARVQTYPKK